MFEEDRCPRCGKPTESFQEYCTVECRWMAEDGVGVFMQIENLERRIDRLKRYLAQREEVLDRTRNTLRRVEEERDAAQKTIRQMAAGSGAGRRDDIIEGQR